MSVIDIMMVLALLCFLGFPGLVALAVFLSVFIVGLGIAGLSWLACKFLRK